MKKIFLIFLSLWIILIALPVCMGMCFRDDCAKDMGEKGSLPKPSTNIKYLDVKTGKVHDTDIEKYLAGVLSAEMPAEYHIEALKAQAVATRSFILSNLGTNEKDHKGADICNNPQHCKGYFDEKTAKDSWGKDKADSYWKKLEKAVKETGGEYMIYEDEVIEAFFFARSGGRTENSEDVWGESRPYLRSVESKVDESHPEFTSAMEVENQEARRLLGVSKSFDKGNIKIGEITYTEGGNVKTIELEGKTYKGTDIRKIFGLKSSDFDVAATERALRFNVRGYGHGVGMSQFGANEMAKNGKKYTEILSHYYTNIQIVKN